MVGSAYTSRHLQSPAGSFLNSWPKTRHVLQSAGSIGQNYYGKPVAFTEAHVNKNMRYGWCSMKEVFSPGNMKRPRFPTDTCKLPAFYCGTLTSIRRICSLAARAKFRFTDWNIGKDGPAV